MTSQPRPSGVPGPDQYRVLRDADLRAYLAQLPDVVARLGGSPQAWSISEVGDGNLNLVFIVKGTMGGIAVKQALPYVRLVGESWPLPLSRSHYEYQALVHQARLAPGLVPAVLHHNEASRAHRHGVAGAAHHPAQGACCRHLLPAPGRPHHDFPGADAVSQFRPCGSRRAEKAGHRRLCRQPRALQDHRGSDLYGTIFRRPSRTAGRRPGSMQPRPAFAKTSTCMLRSRGSSSNSWQARKR